MRAKNHRRGYVKMRSAVSTIAKERIELLLAQAKETYGKDPTFARRYVELAGKISMRTKVRIPRAEKRYICKKCGQPLVPGRNARVRVLPGNPRIIVTCLECEVFRRYPFKKPIERALTSMKPYITQDLPSSKKSKVPRIVLL